MRFGSSLHRTNLRCCSSSSSSSLPLFIAHICTYLSASPSSLLDCFLHLVCEIFLSFERKTAPNEYVTYTCVRTFRLAERARELVCIFIAGIDRTLAAASR